MSLPLNLQGLWIPLITPFKGGRIDKPSLKRLIEYYGAKGISGFILAATTGEDLMLSDDELKQLVEKSCEAISSCNLELPVFVGLSGSAPRKICRQLARIKELPSRGYLISGPNYLRPSQNGLKQYYSEIASDVDLPIIIYNIPYRTGINIANETMLELAALPNVIGVKDCCGSPDQSYALLRNAPQDFSVLTGEDPFFYNAMVHGAPGAIVTGAHILVDDHLAIMNDLKLGNLSTALERWNRVSHIPDLLFEEPNPAPLKYWLWRQGLIDSPEVRTPFLPISDHLAGKIDSCVEKIR